MQLLPFPVSSSARPHTPLAPRSECRARICKVQTDAQAEFLTRTAQSVIHHSGFTDRGDTEALPLSPPVPSACPPVQPRFIHSTISAKPSSRWSMARSSFLRRTSMSE
eukprot:2888018-Prymnesium_polylepis.2